MSNCKTTKDYLLRDQLTRVLLWITRNCKSHVCLDVAVVHFPAV
jgi:hypothetical protein